MDQLRRTMNSRDILTVEENLPKICSDNRRGVDYILVPIPIAFISDDDDIARDTKVKRSFRLFFAPTKLITKPRKPALF